MTAAVALAPVNSANIYQACPHLNHLQTYLSHISVVCKFNIPQYKGFSWRITATFSDVRTSYQCDYVSVFARVLCLIRNGLRVGVWNERKLLISESLNGSACSDKQGNSAWYRGLLNRCVNKANILRLSKQAYSSPI